MRVGEYLKTESESVRKQLEQLLRKYPADSPVYPCSLSAGESLIHEDDPSRMVYYLIKGCVSVVTNQPLVSRHTLAEVTAPDFFGEYEALGGMPSYIAEVRAVTPCRLIAFPSDAYLTWMHSDPDLFFQHVHRILNSLLSQTANERNLHFLDAAGKVSQFLIRAYEKSDKLPETGRLSATRTEIAETTGNSVRTVNRAITKLASRGLVSVKNGKLHLTTAQYEALKKEMESFLLK